MTLSNRGDLRIEPDQRQHNAFLSERPMLPIYEYLPTIFS